MKAGDEVLVFGNPIKCTDPLGKAKLVKPTGNKTISLEEWYIEFSNELGQIRKALIKKNNGKN